MEKCKYLAQNENNEDFDRIAECPRFLSQEEKRVLLGLLLCKVEEYAEDLTTLLRVSEEENISLDVYFDRFYKTAYRAILQADSHCFVKRQEPYID